MKKHFDHESRKIEEKKSVLSFCFHKIINIKIFSSAVFAVGKPIIAASYSKELYFNYTNYSKCFTGIMGQKV